MMGVAPSALRITCGRFARVAVRDWRHALSKRWLIQGCAIPPGLIGGQFPRLLLSNTNLFATRYLLTLTSLASCLVTALLDRTSRSRLQLLMRKNRLTSFGACFQSVLGVHGRSVVVAHVIITGLASA